MGFFYYTLYTKVDLSQLVVQFTLVKIFQIMLIH